MKWQVRSEPLVFIVEADSVNVDDDGVLWLMKESEDADDDDTIVAGFASGKWTSFVAFDIMDAIRSEDRPR